MAACGRLGFEAQTAAVDSAPDVAIDAAPPVPALVAMYGSTTGDSGATSSLQFAIPPVAAGHLLVVAIAEHHGDAIASVVDERGHPLAPTGTRAFNGSTSSELWYETAVEATTGMTITPGIASNFDAWVAEFSGVKGAPAQVAENCLLYPPTIVAVPGDTTVANALVVNVLMAQAPMYVSSALPPFVTFPPLTGNDTAYYIAAQPGSYAADYSIASGSGMTAMTCENTAVWVPSL